MRNLGLAKNFTSTFAMTNTKSDSRVQTLKLFPFSVEAIEAELEVSLRKLQALEEASQNAKLETLSCPKNKPIVQIMRVISTLKRNMVTALNRAKRGIGAIFKVGTLHARFYSHI